ncbi:L-alanine-DL-glutamate epimerase-like enolase superfamily enzyme [Pseudacidovorax intermedius]|uniref:L-alanine-DL-glutamate epimerase-like enolase superfamily enzyme n=1 Tax=Pseudacidovorax intermedius TaxID=433924 RepID=A0A370FEC3_9BURK|nr:mandelate racemase/muconate lactonizing enzyme family protein [Pseudacidovorax intermedius]RDI24094.1 L-alanine-DL-glutamate epimerase-like enolase superfamily enzyme [Pseudacidovorax intermedius]
MTAAATDLRLERIEVFVFRAPADPPVQTSFGIMRDRPALLLRAIADDGAEGWGEVWCNFPTVGAEHRARMALTYLPPLACGPQWASPQVCFEALTEKLAVLAIQCGEPGPLAQIVAGLDIALWDLLGRRHGLPVWKLLAPDLAAPAPVPLYASGLNPTAPEKLAAAKRAEGYRAFKLKVGFGAERDEANLAALREVIGPAAPLMVDANQAWDLDEAIAAGRRMARHDLGWLEEPVRADTPLADWARLAREQPLPLAGGENLAGLAAFDAHIGAEGLSIIQPDLGKWGGFSGCLAVGRRTLAQGKRFCPHWLGAGIGLTASFHLKAAVGGPGYVEVDANSNPLRDLLATPVFALEEGAVHLGMKPGLGVQPDLGAAQAFRIPL